MIVLQAEFYGLPSVASLAMTKAQDLESRTDARNKPDAKDIKTLINIVQTIDTLEVQ